MNSYYKRTIVREDIDSIFLKKRRQLRVFLPPGYNELVAYPVVYCQDGEQFFNYGRLATHATKLILDDNLQPMIIVGVDVDLEHRTAEYAPDGERFEAYCRFFVEEVIPLIERKYAVQQSPSGRILAGDSLGGTVALHLALEHPYEFAKVLSLSGAFLKSTHQRLESEQDLSWLNIYMLIGLQETQVKTERGTFDFLEANREAHRLLGARNAQLYYEEKPGEHLWGFWQGELPGALKYFLG